MKTELVYICEICQSVLEEHHCKAVCPNCGRMFDCSDLPLIQANARVQNNTLEASPGNGLKDLLPPIISGGEEPAAPASGGNVANLP